MTVDRTRMGKAKRTGNGKDRAQNKSEEQRSSGSGHQSRKPPGMEDKCMRCGKHEYQPGQKCPAKNGKCKVCHKIGHFHKVCQNKNRATQDDDDTHIDEIENRQPNPPRVNIIQVINHIEANRGKFNDRKYLKFPIVSHPSKPYNHHLVVRVDTGADINCMNETTFKELPPEVNFLYASMRYRILETQLQTFQYWDSSAHTCSSGGKSI